MGVVGFSYLPNGKMNNSLITHYLRKLIKRDTGVRDRSVYDAGESYHRKPAPMIRLGVLAGTLAVRMIVVIAQVGFLSFVNSEPIPPRTVSRADVALQLEAEDITSALVVQAPLMGLGTNFVAREAKLARAHANAAVIEAREIARLSSSPQALEMAGRLEKTAASEAGVFATIESLYQGRLSDQLSVPDSNVIAAIGSLTEKGALFGVSSQTADPPSSQLEEMWGVHPDYYVFQSKLPKVGVYRSQSGDMALYPTNDLAPVSYTIVEEDIPLDDLGLRLFHRQALNLIADSNSEPSAQPRFKTSFVSAEPVGRIGVERPLRSAVEQGQIVRWVPGSVLKFCILRWTFASNPDLYATVKSNISIACKEWEEACHIRFEHVEAFDQVPYNTTFPMTAHGGRAVLFSVGCYDLGGATVAMAFFPNDDRNMRLLLVNPSVYRTTKYNRKSVLTHELGHILGFKHEHTSTNAPVWSGTFCSREMPTGAAITGYDPRSIMHYPCTPAAGGNTLEATFAVQLSELDIVGARAVYGPPGGPAPTGIQFRDFEPAP